MVEIYQIMIHRCKKYRQDTCANVLDNLKGPSFQSLIKEYISVLKRHAEEERYFDFVINGLIAPDDSIGELLPLMLDLSLEVLKQNREYFTQKTKDICLWPFQTWN